MDAIGFELDKDAVLTSQKAGFSVVTCDLLTYPIPKGRIEGVIGSPPCQPFSRAGKRAGVSVIVDVVRFIDTCATGWHEPEADWRTDPRIGLVVEPLRWVLSKTPDWCAWEQVPDVLPVWEACARVLRAQGWSVWTGLLSAECYGVAQTRERAFLIASRSKTVQPPTPTHQEYRAGEPRLEARSDDLFGGGVLPWVSMADALGWGLPDRPCWTIAGGGTETGGAEPIANAKNRAMLNTGRAWVKGGTRDDAQKVTIDAPAPALTAKSGGQWCWDRPATTVVGSFCPDVIAGPGYRGPGDGPRQNAPGSVKITIEDALVLQSFSRDWPLQGTKTSKFRQVGNAVPPLLAAAVLGSVA